MLLLLLILARILLLRNVVCQTLKYCFYAWRFYEPLLRWACAGRCTHSSFLTDHFIVITCWICRVFSPFYGVLNIIHYLLFMTDENPGKKTTKKTINYKNFLKINMSWKSNELLVIWPFLFSCQVLWLDGCVQISGDNRLFK